MRFAVATYHSDSNQLSFVHTEFEPWVRLKNPCTHRCICRMWRPVPGGCEHSTPPIALQMAAFWPNAFSPSGISHRCESNRGPHNLLYPFRKVASIRCMYLPCHSMAPTTHARTFQLFLHTFQDICIEIQKKIINFCSSFGVNEHSLWLCIDDVSAPRFKQRSSAHTVQCIR